MTTEFKGSSDRGDEERNRIDQLSGAAQMVQGFTYDHAAHLDPTTVTELMLISRRLERLAERLENDPGVVAALAQANKAKTAPEG
ncbi:hypothetical protein ALP8811_01678 [Aliiroseovarius pelagivivens]|uniref:Uncharacterized protein n=1 Tax=Aliiroseovarius pelagivivens TaxID=1639690 RepID=A0A2R8AKT4_9RHOB|nr:hypothetical protein [Aliiroseovarius pelagivivens]SPF76665.1 hypothetical protein ALP8811_01678 [Aliiroseovarius pelagivivens]